MAQHRCKSGRMRPFYDWVNSTGIDGISHTVAANSAWEKCAWFIIAVISLCVTAAQVIMVFTDFFGYPVSVSLSIKHESAVSATQAQLSLQRIILTINNERKRKLRLKVTG